MRANQLNDPLKQVALHTMCLMLFCPFWVYPKRREQHEEGSDRILLPCCMTGNSSRRDFDVIRDPTPTFTHRKFVPAFVCDGVRQVLVVIATNLSLDQQIDDVAFRNRRAFKKRASLKPIT